jgi:hypothetical protein
MLFGTIWRNRRRRKVPRTAGGQAHWKVLQTERFFVSTNMVTYNNVNIKNCKAIYYIIMERKKPNIMLRRRTHRCVCGVCVCVVCVWCVCVVCVCGVASRRPTGGAPSVGPRRPSTTPHLAGIAPAPAAISRHLIQIHLNINIYLNK